VGFVRILQVYMGPYLADRGGGVSVYVRNISERLATRHDVTVFATNPGGLPSFEVVNGVKVERFKRCAPGGAYFLSLEMLLELRKAEFDVVHGHCYHAFPLHFSALAKRKRFVVSTHFHGVGHSVFRDSLIRLFKPFGRRTIRAADKIVAVSEYEKNLLCGQFGLDPDKVVVIPCGVDFGEFEGLRRRKRGFRSVLYVGNLVGYKGVQFLIEVLPRLPRDVVLEIVGKGVLKPFLEKRVRELGVSGRVRFFENLPRRELLQMFVDADVFVLLSRYEAYSMAVAEALVAGTPCIVANASALSEWIDNRTCFGVTYPIRLDELTEITDWVLDDGINGEVASNKWIGGKILDWGDVVRRLENLYNELEVEN
jgi:glycosyltransferase involved in cell wall biosynthesis